MALWGLALAYLALGLAAFAVDRRAIHYFRDHLHRPLFKFALRVTDWAKGEPWIIGALLLYLATRAAIVVYPMAPALIPLGAYSEALLIAFVAGTVVLHLFKVFLGRRRPRDEFEHGLYGFRYFTWQLQYDSFPSGHSMTIFTVATVLSAAIPWSAPFWFLAATWFALTRALLTAHFLSDVFVGAAIGIVAAREVMVLMFPALTPGWF
jgi:membrane-associated phospholipid phosphatase